MEQRIYTREILSGKGIHTLRVILREEFGGTPGTMPKEQLIKKILEIQETKIVPVRNPKGRKPYKPEPEFPESVIGGMADETVLSDDEWSICEMNDSGNVSEEVLGGYFVDRKDGFGTVYSDGKFFPKGEYFVPKATVATYGLRCGDVVTLSVIQGPKIPVVTEIFKINGQSVHLDMSRKSFESFDAAYPTERLHFKNKDFDAYLAKTAPIGLGQRCFVSYNTAEAKNKFFDSVVLDLEENDYFIGLVVGCTPEAASALRKAEGYEVFCSTFDDPTERKCLFTDLALGRAKRLAEQGKNVILGIGDITEVVKSHHENITTDNTVSYVQPTKASIELLRNLFASARKLEGAGSITLLAAFHQSDASFDQAVESTIFRLATNRIYLDSLIRPYGIDAKKSTNDAASSILSEEEYKVYLQNKKDL